MKHIFYYSIAGLILISGSGMYLYWRDTGALHIPSSLILANKQVVAEHRDAVVVNYTKETEKLPHLHSEGSYIDNQHAWISDSNYPLRTNDGGKTWYRLEPPEDSPLSFKQMKGVFIKPYFANLRRGWLIGGDVTWQTEDGGISWRPFTYRIGTIQFADENQGWMVAVESDASPQSFPEKFSKKLPRNYRTTDGGKTWFACSNNNISDAYPIGLGDAYFLSSQTGWARAGLKVEDRYLDGIAQTLDGGCNWKLLWSSEGFDPDERYTGIYFLNQYEGWVTGDYLGSLVHTNDGGRTWEKLNTPKLNLQLFGVYFKNPQEGWILTSFEGKIYRTKDGGISWQELTDQEIVKGVSNNSETDEIPNNWRKGKLFQMIYANK